MRLLLVFVGASGRTGLVRRKVASDRLGVVIRLFVSHHCIENPQKAAGHGDIGLGFDAASTFDQSLSDALLLGIAKTECDGGNAQGPTQCA